MRRLRLLDLFCGAGGAAMGYYRAGFEVVGVDNRPQKNYPFEFHLADALEFCAAHGREFDAIHASPPCQAYSALRVVRPGRAWPDLIAPARAAFEAADRPFIIENVPGAPLISPAIVCGLTLGLLTKRHRLFESTLLLFGSGCKRGHLGEWYTVAGTYSGVRRVPNAKSPKRNAPNAAVASRALGIDWMTSKEMSQAVPPAYTEFIGRQVREALLRGR
jgi:DNA (cytosine-5)-methyltransferase 1